MKAITGVYSIFKEQK